MGKLKGARKSEQSGQLSGTGGKRPPETIWSHPVCYSDAFKKRPSESEFRELISRFDRTPTFGMVRNQAALVSFYQPGPVDKLLFVQSFLCQNLLDDKTRYALRKVIPQDANLERLVFHRRQLLFVLKAVLLYAKEGEGFDPRNDLAARHELGKVCLIANDLLFTQEQEAALTKSDGSREEWERVHDELYSQMIPNAEIMRVPDVYSAMARNDEYLAIFGRESRRFTFSGGAGLLDRFERLSSLSLPRYLRFLFAVWVLYFDLASDTNNFIKSPALFNIGKDTTFSKMTIRDEELAAFFELTTVDQESLAKEINAPAKKEDLRFIHDLTPFRRHPLVYTRAENDVAALIDYQFLGEKISSGIYHTVLDVLRADPGGKADYKNFLMRYWGEVFEMYVNNRLREIFPPKMKKLFYSPMFDFDTGFQAFDGALVLGSDLVVFEAKGKYLTLDAKYDGDKDQLREDLDEKFGKGVRQLVRNIEMVFYTDQAKRRSFSEFDEERNPVNTFGLDRIKKIRRVYPIIVVQDFSLQLGFANWNLRETFTKELGTKSVPEGIVRPLTVMTVEDLESVLAHVNRIPFQNILDYYTRNLEPIFSFRHLFRRYLALRGVRPRPNPWVDSRVGEVFDSMKAMFHTVD